MKFKGPGNTVVWDKERERELCRFEKGQLETEDPRTCEILVKLGYEHDGELPKPELVKEIDDELAALRAKGKEYGIKSAHSMKKETLQTAIDEYLKKLGEALDKAAALGIDGYEDMSLEDLQAAIADVEKGE